MIDIELLVDGRNNLGEGPLWDVREQRLHDSRRGPRRQADGEDAILRRTGGVGAQEKICGFVRASDCSHYGGMVHFAPEVCTNAG